MLYLFVPHHMLYVFLCTFVCQRRQQSVQTYTQATIGVSVFVFSALGNSFPKKFVLGPNIVNPALLLYDILSNVFC